MNKQQLYAENFPVSSGPINPKSVCVVGSGPVGIAFALRLASAGKAVTLIDSGAFNGDKEGKEFFSGTVASAAAAQDCNDTTLLNKGTLYSRRDYLTYSRYLGNGGNSRRWCVQWHPADSTKRIRLVPGALADFEARPEFDIPAWATPGAEVYNRYQAALKFFDLAEHDFDIGTYQDSYLPIPLATEQLPPKLFHFALATSVYQQRMAEVLSHPGIDVRSDLHFVKMETSKQERVTRLIMVRPDGTEVRIEAAHYVLALGGIENSRQLLLAKEDDSLADPYDVFGRWFIDHPHTRLGYLTSQDPDALLQETAWYDFQKVNGTPIMRGHELSPDAARELGLLRFSIDLVGRPVGDGTKTGVSLAQAWDHTKRRDFVGMLPHLAKLALSPLRAFNLVYQAYGKPVHHTGKGGWSDTDHRYHGCDSVSVEAMLEQRPSRDNRIRLGAKRDPLGCKLPILQWSWSRKEVASIHQSADYLADAFKQADIGSFVTMRELGQGEIPRAGSGFHHMGGTRQSVDPAEGVVNADNRVHSVENLTLIGSSIFPNSVGFANPTLTAVADAIRVADCFAGVSTSVRQKSTAAKLLQS